MRIFFITNRECAPRDGSDAACPQQDDTLANLEALGLGSPTLADDLMLKGERAGMGQREARAPRRPSRALTASC